MFLKTRLEIRAAKRLSHPKASRRGAVRNLQVDATKILRHQQVFAVDVCPIQLKDITEEVLKLPRKLRAKTASEATDLSTETQPQFADGLELSDLIFTALADTGSEVAGVIGIELLKQHVTALHNAKIAVILLTVGKTALAGGTQGVTVTFRLPVITPERYKVFQCLNFFLHVAVVGPRLILHYPFLLPFGLAVVPGQEALVQV